VYLFIAFCAVLLWHIASELLNRKERKELLDRIMSKNYQEYEYYKEKYPVDVEEVVKVRDEARNVRAQSPMTEQDFEKPLDPEVKQFLESTEVDWNPEEVDVAKLKEMLNNREEPA
jgi:hypothetical protein